MLQVQVSPHIAPMQINSPQCDTLQHVKQEPVAVSPSIMLHTPKSSKVSLSATDSPGGRPHHVPARRRQQTDISSGNRLCMVCGDTASGTHYRVLTCEGCKGFWRRTIQRGSGPQYKCRSQTDQCPVSVESRGRCQRCRYQACVRAGMVADLVMSDKERLSRIRLVDQNRERRTGNRDAPTQQDAQLFALAQTAYTANQPPAPDARFVHDYSQSCAPLVQALFDVMATGLVTNCSIADLASTTGNRLVVQDEVSYLYTAYFTEPQLLLTTPSLAKLSAFMQTYSIANEELLLSVMMVVARPRLTWPLGLRADLAAIWEVVSGAVRRRYAPSVHQATTAAGGRSRYGILLQLVHMTTAVASALRGNQLG